MEFSRFKENENRIVMTVKSNRTILETQPSYAAKIGVVISMFALIEDHSPLILCRLTGINQMDARAIMGTFRAFSNRIDLLKAVYRSHERTSPKFVFGSYFAGLFTEANKIRNKYAHAKYSLNSKNKLGIEPFSSDYNRKTVPQEHTAEEFENDINRLRRIIAELDCLLWEDEISKSLYGQLSKLDTQQ